MKKKERIVTYTDKELRRMLARGESKTDWAAAMAIPQAEVEKMADEEDGPLPEGWEKTIIIGLPPLPPGKEAVKLRIDRDVLDWFRHTGKGYQTRMNNVLRAFVTSRLRMDETETRR